MKRGLLFKIITIFILWLLSAITLLAQSALPNGSSSKNRETLSSQIQYNTAWTSVKIREMLDRPLFQPTRRPLPEAQNTEDSFASTPLPDLSFLDQIVLLGVTIGPGGRTGLIRLSGDSKAKTVREGEILNGWHVKKILESSITLSDGNNDRDLFLFHKTDFPSLEP